MRTDRARWRRTTCHLIIFAFLGCIIFSGFAHPLHYGKWSLWPWSQAWFMFSYDTGYDYELQAFAEFDEGVSVALDINQRFKFKVGSSGNRFQEVPRNTKTMTALATHLCTWGRIRSIDLVDLSWKRSPGKRLPWSEVPPSEINKKVWVEHWPCNS